MRVTRSVEFDAAHRIPGRTLHGHRYRLDVAIVGDVQSAGPEAGMVIDRAKVDVVLADFVLRFHHRTLLHFLDPLFLYLTDVDALDASSLPRDVGGVDEWGVDGTKFVPTLANLAQYFANMLANQEIGVEDVTLWNTPKSNATATPQPKCERCLMRGEHTAGCEFRAR